MWSFLPLPEKIGSWDEGYQPGLHLCHSWPLFCAAHGLPSQRLTQLSPDRGCQVPASFVFHESGRSGDVGDGFKYWPQPNFPAVRICQENLGVTTFFLMEKWFILLEKYYFTNGEKIGRTCTKVQTDFSGWYIYKCCWFFPLYYLIVCFVSKKEYI